MDKRIILYFLFSVISSALFGQKEKPGINTDLLFKGQLSSWANLNTSNPYPLYLGGRYIPQLNYNIGWPNDKLFDFEVSANMGGLAGIHFFDSASIDGSLKAYRAWARYSSQQLEIRFGLQKIDFGTATLLRTLRWFDQIDPRDPLQITTGVWAGLARYYFLNNINIWLWGLYGNDNPKGREILKTSSKIPEIGGRLQFPVPIGEAAFSYHHRMADASDLAPFAPGQSPGFDYTKIAENRLGFDAKWDLIVGLWLEAAWVNKKENIGIFTNQESLTLGTDYTFGIGSGLNVLFEYMLFSFDEDAFKFSNSSNFSGLSIMYPIGMFDSINAIFYYDWTNNSLYNFVNWYRQFDHVTLYVMGYWNPENAQLPAYGSEVNLYGGKGLQVMFVYNH